MVRTPTKTPQILQLGFASFQDGTFELIVRDPETGRETTLEGRMKPNQLVEVDRLLPTCVMIRVAPEPLPAD